MSMIVTLVKGSVDSRGAEATGSGRWMDGGLDTRFWRVYLARREKNSRYIRFAWVAPATSEPWNFSPRCAPVFALDIPYFDSFCCTMNGWVSWDLLWLFQWWIIFDNDVLPVRGTVYIYRDIRPKPGVVIRPHAVKTNKISIWMMSSPEVWIV